MVFLGNIDRGRARKGQAVIVIEEMLPPRSSVVMTGTWFVQAAGEGKHRTHSSEVLQTTKEFLLKCGTCHFPKGFFATGKRNSSTVKHDLMLRVLWLEHISHSSGQAEGRKWIFSNSDP